VPLLSGLGISSVQDKIKSAFEVMRAATQLVAPVPLIEVEVVNVSREEAVARFRARVETSNLTKTEHYSATDARKFDHHTGRLAAAALSCSHVMSEIANGRDGVWAISVPQQTSEEIIEEATRGPAREPKKFRPGAVRHGEAR